MPINLIVAAAAAMSPHPTLPAPQGSQLINSIQACQKIGDDAARLACYDRSVSALTSANARGDVTVVDRQQMREARRSLFGFSVPRLPFFSGSKDKDVQDEPKQLVSTVASFRALGNGLVRVAMTTPASVWESTEPSDMFDVKAGAKVTISHGALGSYFMEVGSNRAVRARRVQ